MWTDTRGEGGFALIGALLAVVILGGLVTIFVATAIFETRATGHERRQETSIHVAEAATDDVIVDINEDLDLNTTYDGTTDHVYLRHAATTYTDEKTWARAVADSASQTVLTRTGGGGEGVAIRPVDASTGLPLDLLFGVGYVPDRASALAGTGNIRVIKLQIQPGVYSPATAILSNGDLYLGGNAETSGLTGNVHANGNVYVEGSSGECDSDSDNDHDADDNGLCVDGDLSMSGTLKDGSGTDLTDTQQQNFGQDHVTGTLTEGVARRVTAEFTARVFYDPSQALNTYTDPGTGNAVEARWWILCPNGTVRTPADGPDPASICALSTISFWTDDQTNNFHGWDFKASCAEFGNNPCWSGDKIVSGAYYVYNSNAVSNGGKGAVTILVSCSGLVDPEEPCSGDANGAANGNYVMKGKPEFKPALPAVHFIADRDLVVNGQAGTQIDGFIGAREQIETSGSGNLTGSLVSLEKPHTSGSVVAKSSAKGSFTVSYEQRLRVPLPGVTQIVAWNEL